MLHILLILLFSSVISATDFRPISRYLTLLEKVAGAPGEVSLRASKCNNKMVNEHGETTLSVAARTNQYELAHQLIIQKADIEHQNSNKETPLIIAAKYNSTKTAYILLAHGAKPNARDSEGRTALSHAAEKNNNFIIVALLKKRADVTIRDKCGSLPFDHAQHEITKRLLNPNKPPIIGERLEQEHNKLQNELQARL